MAIILVAFDTGDGPDDTWESAQRTVMEALAPVLGAELPKGYGQIDSWWIAEDVRFDGSDNDSAVFVRMGKQVDAHRTLAAQGLTDDHNYPREARETPFTPHDDYDVSLTLTVEAGSPEDAVIEYQDRSEMDGWSYFVKDNRTNKVYEIVRGRIISEK